MKCERCEIEFDYEPCEIETLHETIYVCRECWLKVTLQVARRLNPKNIIIITDRESGNL